MRLRNTCAMLAAGLWLVLGFVAPATAQTQKFDGNYVGNQTRTGGKGCGLGREVTMPVKDGGFMWGVAPSREKIAIAPDGTIEGKVGTLSLKGTATASGLDFTTYSPGCNNLWHFDKK